MTLSALYPVLRTLAIATLLYGLLGIQGTTLAADCKGLSKSRCDSSAACSWVSGYTSKSGKKVSSYCRTKPSSVKGTGKSSNKASRSGSSAKSRKSEAKNSPKAEKKSLTQKKKFTKKTTTPKAAKEQSGKKTKKTSTSARKKGSTKDTGQN